MKIGIINEGKVPPDSRVPLSPQQCSLFLQEPLLELVVQSSPGRCYTDEEYRQAGVSIVHDVSDCDILMGVKEVPVNQLIPNKTYLFFSHTIKKQPYNQHLLWAILDKNIRLIDFEALTDIRGKRVIAFGKFAGMVGAHNALWAYAQRTREFGLPRLKSLVNYAAAKEIYLETKIPPIKVVLTGTGRVATGAALVLSDMRIERVPPKEFLTKKFDHSVFTQLASDHYAAPNDGSVFHKKDFYENPAAFHSIFMPYTEVADVMINGIYWDSRSPEFFTQKDMASSKFRIMTIADVTCDIAPVSSIPSTLKASTIDDPVFGYDPKTGKETAPFQPNAIDMMTIDNLPNELPRDASTAFGQMFMEHVMPELFKKKSDMIDRATVTENGELGKHFRYLEDYATVS